LKNLKNSSKKTTEKGKINSMSILQSLFSEDTRDWRTKLEWASDDVIYETGLTRDKLKDVLEHLERNGIIKSY
jgi:hypothetical protein